MKALLVIVVSLVLAWWLQTRPPKADGMGGEVEAPSPQADLVVALLGGFRGLAAEVVWFRADRLQDAGRYGELAQLATWLTFLEPRTPEVWAYAAWNLAYNVSVMMSAPEDRWRWVEAGIRLLRDDGLRLNPQDPVLHRELAWLFLAKVGGRLDDAAPYYRKAWAARIEAVRAADDWARVRMVPARMAAVEAEYGRLDWTDPLSSALYWGHEGLLCAVRAGDRRDLRQQLLQTLMSLSLQDARFAPRALREIRAAQAEAPHPALDDLARRFAARFRLAEDASAGPVTSAGPVRDGKGTDKPPPAPARPE